MVSDSERGKGPRSTTSDLYLPPHSNNVIRDLFLPPSRAVPPQLPEDVPLELTTTYPHKHCPRRRRTNLRAATQPECFPPTNNLRSG